MCCPIGLRAIYFPLLLGEWIGSSPIAQGVSFVPSLPGQWWWIVLENLLHLLRWIRKSFFLLIFIQLNRCFFILYPICATFIYVAMRASNCVVVCSSFSYYHIPCCIYPFGGLRRKRKNPSSLLWDNPNYPWFFPPHNRIMLKPSLLINTSHHTL